MQETPDFAEVCFCIPWKWYTKLSALAESNGMTVDHVARAIFVKGYREEFFGTTKGM